MGFDKPDHTLCILHMQGGIRYGAGSSSILGRHLENVIPFAIKLIKEVTSSCETGGHELSAFLGSSYLSKNNGILQDCL